VKDSIAFVRFGQIWSVRKFPNDHWHVDHDIINGTWTSQGMASKHPGIQHIAPITATINDVRLGLRLSPQSGKMFEGTRYTP
jgi:hypothetical protein